MSKHTPGPWRLEGSDNFSYHLTDLNKEMLEALDVLAKILVTAAVEDLRDAYMPFRDADRKTVKNLKHF